jgi:hypothetical protein
VLDQSYGNLEHENKCRDTNVIRILYKPSQTYDTETKSDNYLGTEGVVG